ncbi:hypothetical protein WJX73_008387 [Symbiochloris irregularis]|uniref:JmjC domain-containing protein n=1 Tax=Symbiochloris irregularis TaxID=706552 RepID=A0AAW1PRK6_9CHLO
MAAQSSDPRRFCSVDNCPKGDTVKFRGYKDYDGLRVHWNKHHSDLGTFSHPNVPDDAGREERRKEKGRARQRKYIANRGQLLAEAERVVDEVKRRVEAAGPGPMFGLAAAAGVQTKAALLDILKKLDNIAGSSEIAGGDQCDILRVNAKVGGVNCARCKTQSCGQLLSWQDGSVACSDEQAHNHMQCSNCRADGDQLIAQLNEGDYLNLIRVVQHSELDDLSPTSLDDMARVEPSKRPAIISGWELGVEIQELSELSLEAFESESDQAAPSDTTQIQRCITRAYSKGNYFSCNFIMAQGGQHPMTKFIEDSTASDFILGSKGVYDARKLTLLLLTFCTDELSGTPMHLDWTEALNHQNKLLVTPAIRKRFPNAKWAQNLDSKQGSVWNFFSPPTIEKVETWCQKRLQKRLSDEDFPLLNEAQMNELKEYVGTGWVELEQGHGELIFVPPGWLHQVRNLSPNLKVAWERLVHDRLRSYPTVSKLISRFIGGRSARDYVGFSTCCVNALLA